MQAPLTRRQALSLIAMGGVAPWRMALATEPSGESAAESTGPSEGYRLEFTYPLGELIGDLKEGERGDPSRQSSTPHRDWYTREVRRHWGSWGPGARYYLPLPELRDRPLAWKRERVLAVAAHYIGYGYQHHHIPDWSPPASWPWQETCVGHNGKGVDCSNLTSFVYNQGFGIRMTAAVVDQSELDRATFEPTGHLALERIKLPREHAAMVEKLRTGDLVYIRGRENGPITHVVLWVGSIGRAMSGVPLILDSHGGGVKDDSGRVIPCGVHLRPFREHSWYHRCASHAHRVFTR